MRGDEVMSQHAKKNILNYPRESMITILSGEFKDLNRLSEASNPPLNFYPGLICSRLLRQWWNPTTLARLVVSNPGLHFFNLDGESLGCST
jgi:hypothetical protein